MIRNPVALLALFSLSLLMQAQTPEPLWEIDLSRFDYQGRPPAALAHLPPSVAPMAGWANQQGVVFTGPNRVVVYFVVHDEPPGTTDQHEPALSDPFRLIAVFLNASNGALIRK